MPRPNWIPYFAKCEVAPCRGRTGFLISRSARSLMALMGCPECHRPISDWAPSCPHCGCPVTKMAEPESTSPPFAPAAGSRRGTAWKGVAGCLWLFLLASLGLFVGGWTGCVKSGPVQQGGGEWQGLGALGKLFAIVEGAFWGAVIGAVAGGVVLTVLNLVIRRAAKLRAQDRELTDTESSESAD